jgi:membrane protease YdiL (CAAX protease family)
VTWLDHILLFFLVLALPAYAAWEMPKLARQIEAGDAAARAREYGWTMAIQWAATLTLLWHWSRESRAAAMLGLVVPDGWRLGITLAASVAAIAFFAAQARVVLTTEKGREAVRRQFQATPGVVPLLPHTEPEARLFTGLGITAGVCEEILYRGFLLWYLAAFLPYAAAVVLAVVVFGVAHIYQGAKGIVRTGAAGTVAMVLYLATGSLIAPIVLHATVDVASGWMAFVSLRGNSAAAADQPV